MSGPISSGSSPVSDARPSVAQQDVTGGPKPLANPVAMKASRLSSMLRSSLMQSGSLIFTGASTSAGDCAADYSFVIRQLFNDFGIDSPAFAAEGTTTGFNAVQGVIAAHAAFDRYQIAQRFDYTPGKIESSIDIARGIFQGAGGAMYAAYRPLSILSSVNGLDTSSIHASTASGRGAFVTSTAGNALFGVFYAAVAGWFAYSLTRMYKFKGKFFKDKDVTKLTDAGNVKNLMEFLLKKRLETNAEGTLKKMLKAHSNSPLKHEKIKKELGSLAKKATQPWVHAMLKEIEKLPMSSSVSQKEVEERVERLLAALDECAEEKQAIIQGLGLDRCEDKELKTFVNSLSFAELLGLDYKTAQRTGIKEKKIAENLGSACAISLKKAMETGLLDRLSSEDPYIKQAALEEAGKIIASASKAMKENLFIGWNLLIAGVIGTIATILAFIFTGGIGAAVAGGLFLACSVAMLLADVPCMLAAQTSPAPLGRFDKWLLGVNTALGVVSFITVIVLASVSSMGALPLAVALVIGVLWLASNIYAHVRLNQREERYEKAHPTLASLQKRISSKTPGDPIDVELMQRIKNLPKEMKKALKADASESAGIKEAEKRTLSEEDQVLDRSCNFGYEFFMEHTEDVTVLRAVEKACESMRTQPLRGLYERLRALSKKDISADEVRKFFTERLNEKEQELVAQNIYNKRAKKASSRHFASLSIGELKKVLLKTSEVKALERFSTYSMQWISALS